MRNVLLGLAALLLHGHAAAHHSPIHVSVSGADTDSLPGFALIPLVVLAAIGIVRAVKRHRKDR